MTKLQIYEDEKLKRVKYPGYNHLFNKLTGECFRWGEKREDDPCLAPAPELLDIEISTVVSKEEAKQYENDSRFHLIPSGCNGKGCYFCYKGNNKNNVTVSMTLNTFKQIMQKIPKTVCQIAFGITSIDSNPNLWAIMEHTRKLGIVPNITINGIGITREHLLNLKRLCGAVAVSVNPYNYIESLACIKRMIADFDIKQTNIHYVIHKDSYNYLFDLIDNIYEGEVLNKINALVLLAAKDKQECGLTPITVEEYSKIIEYAKEKRVRLGFDSCSANVYTKCIYNDPNFDKLIEYVEPCESGLFSFYINTFGEGYACSFVEGITHKWDVLNCIDFNKDIWYSNAMKNWRKRLFKCSRNCPIYKTSEK